jgi:TP901 family phage tail tape measure protein
MSVGAIEAGKAFVRLLVNDDALTKGLKSAQAKIKMFASATGTLGRQLLAASAAMATPLVAGTKVYADFEKQMAQVSTMLDDPSQYMGQFSEGIKQLAVQFGEGTDSLAKGLYDILSASVAPAEAMDVLRTSVMAAKAGISDTGTAANAIVTIMNAYQMSAGEAGRISDWLFQVIKRGQTTFEEFAPNVGNMATIAATAGVSLDELGAIFATITRNGVQTEEAVTAINAILSTFLSPSKEAADLAEQLGINLSVSALQGEGLAKTFQSLASLPPDVISKLFPNIRALKGVLPALRNLEGFADDMAALGSSAGSTEEAYRKLAATVSTQFDQVKQAVLLAAAEIGAALKDMVADGAVKITDIAKATAQWIKENQGLVVTLGKMALLVGAIGGALTAVSAIATTTAAVFGGLAMASTGLNMAFAALAANPVVATLVAVTAAAGLLIYVLGELETSTISVSNAQADILASGDKKRKQDMQALAHLQELAKKQKLSNDEVKEASAIIDRLETSYGDLGLSLDSTTGKIDGATKAYDRMAAAMEKNVAKQLKTAVMEAQTNAQLLEAELSRIRDTWAMNPFAKTKQMDELSRQMEVQAEKAKILSARYRDLMQGNDEAITGSPAGPQTKTPVINSESVELKNAEFAKKIAERAHEAKMALIEDENKRELETIKGKHAMELEEAKKAGDDLVALKQVQAAEIKAIEEKQARDRRDREQRVSDDIRKLQIEGQYKGLEQKLKLIDQEQAIEMREALKRGDSTAGIQAKYDLQRAQARKEYGERVQQIEDEIATIQIETTKTGIQKDLALIEQQRKEALRDAAEAGDPAALVQKKFDALARQAKLGGYAKMPELTGTFSGWQAARMGGAASVEKEQLATQKKIADSTAKTVRVLEAGMSLI